MQFKTIPAIAFLAAFHTLATAQVKSSETDILTIYKGSHAYKEVSIAGKTTEVYVDDKKVAADEIPHYDSLMRVMRTDVDEENGDQAREDEQAERDQEQAERDQEQAVRDREQAEKDRGQAQNDQEQAARDREQGERDRAQGEQDRIQGERDRGQGEIDRAQGERDRAQGERDHARAEADMAAMRDILHFLVDKKVVSDPEHVNSLDLTDTALYVNGVKQPNEILEPLKEKYRGWSHDRVSYGNSNCNCDEPNIFIHIDLPGGR
jgi:hypothetical protein